MRHLDDGQIAELIDTAGRRTGGPADRSVESHLAECSACRERVEEARQIAERARAILATAVPAVSPAAPIPEFAQVLHRAGRARRRGNAVSARWLAWAATVVVAAGLGWYVRGTGLEAPADRQAAPPVAESAMRMDVAAPAEGPPVPMLADSRSTAEGRAAAAPTPNAAASPAGQERRLVRERMAPLANRQEADDAGKAATPPAQPGAQPLARSDDAGRLALRQPAPAPAEQAPTLGALEPGLRSRPFADPNREVVSGEVVSRVLGGRPASVEGLSVDVFYQLAAEPDVIYSEQRLPGGKVVQLAQRRAGAPPMPELVTAAAARRADAAQQPAPAAEMKAGDRAPVVSVDTIEVGGLRIVVRAGVSPDSLRALVRRIRR